MAALAEGKPDGLERSSGAPAPRGVAAVATAGGGSLAPVLAPSGRGAPGALGLRSGSKASPWRKGEGLASPATGGVVDSVTAGGIAAALRGWTAGGYGAAA